MRSHAGRLVAAAVAIIIATAFVTATAVGANVLERTAYNAISVGYAQADVVVSTTSDAFPSALVEQVRQSVGVSGADGRFTTYLVLEAGHRSDSPLAAPLPSTPALRIEPSRGEHPARPGEVMIADVVAERLGLTVGSTVETPVWDNMSEGDAGPPAERLTVTGLFAHPGAAFDPHIPSVFGTSADVARWAGLPESMYHSILVTAEDGTSSEQLRNTLAPQLRESGGVVRTADEHAAYLTARFTSGAYILAAVLAGLVGVALVVAGMVIANTFTVLVAQRTRELALLRCIGATRRQVRNGVLVEATVLGVVASVAGIAVGVGLAQLAVIGLRSLFDGPWVPRHAEVSVLAVVVPLVVGTAMTVLAARGPARAATRVAPLAALRPSAVQGTGTRTSAARVLVCTGLLGTGGVLLAAGAWITSQASTAAGLALGVLGGAVSFGGVMAGAVVIVPALLAAVARILRRTGGVPAKIAAVNAVRHPRRTASTMVALLIGVTLVTTMSVGAASARATFESELDSHYPVDVVVGPVQSSDSMGELPPGTAAAVSGVEGVETAVPWLATRAHVEGVLTGGNSEPGPPEGDADRGGGLEVDVLGVDPAAVAEVARVELYELRAGTAIVPAWLASEFDLLDGDTLRLSAAGGVVHMRVAIAPDGRGIVVTEEDLTALAPGAPASELWVGLTSDATAAETVRAIQDAVSDVAGGNGAIPVTGAAAQRAEVRSVLDTMLMVVIGLLLVSVLIALIGVGNTLSLSVIERSRESATLRALGMTRRQLRQMLAVEGVLVAVVGAVLGLALGLLYGWLGTLTAFGGVWEVILDVPWLWFAVILGIAVAAGLVASVLPGRRAAKAAPVAALGIR
ncbi:ABC transporter permease [Phytoactinopolyspora mesophila]|nr:FtsX-like permease family protein [Phytoactinopolyspora mesophila]